MSELTQFEDFVSLLRRRVAEQPAAAAITVLPSGEEDSLTWTFADLDDQARRVAAVLRSCARPGDRALLLLPTCLDYAAAFFGCLYAGIIAVPLHPPAARRESPRITAIASDSEPRIAITRSAILSRTGAGELGADNALRWLAIDGEEVRDAEPLQSLAAPRPEDIAFLQYTSGSTNTPRGVKVTHGNLLHNHRATRHGFRLTADDRYLTWLPLHHDLGLIAGMLLPIWMGSTAILMPPIAFLQSPIRWLRAIERHGVTASGAPNFAYELCLARVSDEDRRTLDLSRWRIAYNAAEPVRSDTLKRFAATFAPSGFRQESFMPAYGLAEATLLVCTKPPGVPPRFLDLDGTALQEGRVTSANGSRSYSAVGCGEVTTGQRVVITDPVDGRECPPEVVGEIRIAGPSVAAGYWRSDPDSVEVFGTRVEGYDDAFLRTGDLGFFNEGELFIAGRLKDLVIVDGRNHYPQDIELTVERCHPAVRMGGAAVFGVDTGSKERLVAVVELERNSKALRALRKRSTAAPEAEADAIVRAVRGGVALEHDVRVDRVVLLDSGTLPKTTSGKVRRSACRSSYLTGTLGIYSG